MLHQSGMSVLDEVSDLVSLAWAAQAANGGAFMELDSEFGG